MLDNSVLEGELVGAPESQIKIKIKSNHTLLSQIEKLQTW
jgi:hypothetical protein